MRGARNRCGFVFRPTPVELEPEWHEVTCYQRMVGGELYRVLGGDPQRSGGDWQETVCRRLAVHGNERSAFKRALSALLDKGLIVVTDGTYRVLFAPPAVLLSRAADNQQTAPISAPSLLPSSHQATSILPPDYHQVHIRIEPSTENHSIDETQSRLDQIREEEESANTPAAPPPAELGVEPAEPPKPKRKPSQRDTDKLLLKQAIDDETKARELPLFAIPSSALGTVLTNARRLAESKGLELGAALHQLVGEGIEQALERGKDLKWGVVDWQPARASVTRLHDRRASVATTHLDFADAPSIEEQFANMAARRAAAGIA